MLSIANKLRQPSFPSPVKPYIAYLGKGELFMRNQLDGRLVNVSGSVVVLCIDLFKYRIL
jgi:hypothetical protein